MKATITPQQYERLSVVFDAACDAEPADRDAMLSALRRDDPDLGALVHRMLALHDDEPDDAFLQHPVIDIASVLDEEDDARAAGGSRSIPHAIGRYRIVSRIGEGSVGDVYLAEQRYPVARRVAVKVLRQRAASADAPSRFTIEARALATLSHPGIAQIHDAGVTDDDIDSGEHSTGRAYLVMEYVDGMPIDEACRLHGLNREQRLRLFIDLCDAVQHAHQQGVIHRDLKPSNILVVVRDGGPQIKVIDFGIARLTEQSGSIDTRLTMQGQVLGTLAYMSPEQLRGGTIDTRTDIYALGVVLHQLLTDRLPFALDDLSLADALEKVSTDTPTRAMRTDRALRGDLTTIVEKAMAREPTMRYETVPALAADIARYLHHEPITARAPSRAYQATKFVQRHRAFSAMAVFIVALLVFGAYQIDDARRNALIAQQRAERQYEDAKATAEFLLNEMLFDIERIHGASGLRIKLLDEIHSIMERFRAEGSDDPAFLNNYAKVLHALGNIAQDEGRFDVALEHLQRAAAIREEVVARAPDNPEYWMELSIVHVRVGNLLPYEPVAPKLEHYLDAHAIDERLVDAHPDNRRYLDNLFWSYDRLYDSELKQDPALMATYVQRAAETVDQLKAQFPDHWLTRLASHRMETIRYIAARHDDDYAAMEVHARRALAILTELQQERPNDSTVYRYRAGALTDLAGALTRQGRLDEAEVQLFECMALSDRMMEIEPGFIYDEHRLLACYARLGRIAEQRGELSRAIEFHQSALERAVLLNSNVTNPEYVNRYAHHPDRISAQIERLRAQLESQQK